MFAHYCILITEYQPVFKILFSLEVHNDNGIALEIFVFTNVEIAYHTSKKSTEG